MIATTTRNTYNQHGFALASVLIVLLVLALVVAALLSNQTLAMRETSDVLTSATRAQESHNVHRTCLKQVREKMSKSNLESGIAVDWSNPLNINSNGVTGTCKIEAGENGTLNAWVPQLRITTTVGTQVEITDWRYPPCAISTTVVCFSATSSITVKMFDGTNRVVIPQFLLGEPVQTAWRNQNQ